MAWKVNPVSSYLPSFIKKLAMNGKFFYSHLHLSPFIFKDEEISIHNSGLSKIYECKMVSCHIIEIPIERGKERAIDDCTLVLQIVEQRINKMLFFFYQNSHLHGCWELLLYFIIFYYIKLQMTIHWLSLFRFNGTLIGHTHLHSAILPFRHFSFHWPCQLIVSPR